ncbi:MAG TPA: CPBP family intramembrane glutamic endopeptidase [Marinagarivorans sp.]
MQTSYRVSWRSEVARFAGFCRDYSQAIIVIASATVIMVCAESSNIQWITSAHIESLMLYGVVPIVLLIVLGNRSLRQLALQLGDWHFWLPASVLYLVIALPLVYLGIHLQSVSGYYHNGHFNFGHHIFETSIYLLGWEYFFRGFLIAGLRRQFSRGAILLQLIPFTLLHLGKPDIETLSCILSGLAWGYICYRAQSFWPAFFMHLIVNIFTVYWVNFA